MWSCALILNTSTDWFLFSILDTPLPWIIFGIFMAALLLVLLVAALLVFVLYQAYNKIKYVFFPSCQPPLNIEVSSDSSVIHLLLFRKMSFPYHAKKRCLSVLGQPGFILEVLSVV